MAFKYFPAAQERHTPVVGEHVAQPSQGVHKADSARLQYAVGQATHSSERFKYSPALHVEHVPVKGEHEVHPSHSKQDVDSAGLQ